MSKRLYDWLKNQPKIEVIAKAEENAADKTWLVAFAFVFTSIFFLFSSALWRALMAGG